MTTPYIFMLEQAQNPIQLGDTFQATVGCGKTRYDCQKFNNLDNMRAFLTCRPRRRRCRRPTS